MEMFRSAAGQFRFTFFTHGVANAGPEELKRRIGDDGHVDEGMDRRLIEVIIAGKRFIRFVHDSQGRRRRTVGSQGREGKERFVGTVGDDFARIDGPAAADAEDEVRILNGFFAEQAVDMFVRRIIAVPEGVQDLQVRFGNSVEERLFCLGKGCLAADDDDLFAEVLRNFTDSVVGVRADRKSRQD